MSRKDNLRNPGRREAILAKRERGYELHPVMTARGPAPTLMEKLKAKLSRSKYTPHFGAKQEARQKRQNERDAVAAFA